MQPLKKIAPIALPVMILFAIVMAFTLKNRKSARPVSMPVLNEGEHLYTDKTPRFTQMEPQPLSNPGLFNPNRMFIRIARQIRPSIVTVYTSKEMTAEDWFGRKLPDDAAHKRPFKSRGMGSGIIIRSDGYILTNNHVIEDMDEITIRLLDKREFTGRLAGRDPKTDVALIKIDIDGLTPAPLGNSDSVEIGEWVIAIGSPLNLESTVTAGIVSAMSRNMNILDNRGGDAIQNFIQTDAAVNPGNSGGALVNLKGEVIGINTAIATRSNFFMGYSFAIPINIAKKVVDDFTQYGEVRRGYLGIYIRPVDDITAKGVGLESPQGVLIYSLQEDRAAAAAGLKAGDVILEVNGRAVNQPNELQSVVGIHRPGEIVRITYWRNGRSYTTQVTLFDKDGKIPNDKKSVSPARIPQPAHKKDIGLRFDLHLNGADSSVTVTEVIPYSTASEAGLIPGDIILKFNDKSIKDTSDLRNRLQKHKAGEIVKLAVRSKLQGDRFFDRIIFLQLP